MKSVIRLPASTYLANASGLTELISFSTSRFRSGSVSESFFRHASTSSAAPRRMSFGWSPSCCEISESSSSYAPRVSFDRGRYVSRSSPRSSTVAPSFRVRFVASAFAAAAAAAFRFRAPPSTSGFPYATRSPNLVFCRWSFSDSGSPDGSSLREPRACSVVSTRLEFARYSYWRWR